MSKIQEITVSIDKYIDSIFDKLPSNSIINKGRCGIGGTTVEIETKRNSIIVVPTIGIIDSKCSNYEGKIEEKYKSNPKIFGIKGNRSKKALVAMLEDNHPVKKIFTTPAGLKKLMECGHSKELIMQDWFLLLDEYHTSATDAYRDDIITPFDYFWSFPEENRAMISATPFRFSDKRFSELDVHTIKIKESLGTIDMFHVISVMDCLHYFLRNTDQFKGNLHIFFNSVTEIAEALRISQVGHHGSIYIADSKINMDRLDELKLQFHDKPSTENFSKINFYTSRYFEGWDLVDENPTIVLVTFTEITTSKLGIPNKAYQAIGRSRNPIDRIIHITDHRDKKEFISFEEIQRQNIERAHSVIKSHNEHVNDSLIMNFSIDSHLKELCGKYAKIDKDTNIAEYNDYLADQFINQEYCDQDYNHIDYIKEAWAETNYTTYDFRFDPPPIPANFKKLKETSKVFITVTYLEMLENNKDKYPIERFDELRGILPKGAQEWINAYYTLGVKAMEDVQYNPSKIRKMVIEHHNAEQKPKLIKHLKNSFPSGTYTLEHVKSILYWAYEEFEIKNLNGTKKSGKIKDLYEYFNIAPKGTPVAIGRKQYDAMRGKYNVDIDGEVERKEGFKFH